MSLPIVIAGSSYFHSLRWPVVEVDDEGSVEVREWNGNDDPSKKFDTRPFSLRTPPSGTGILTSTVQWPKGLHGLGDVTPQL